LRQVLAIPGVKGIIVTFFCYCALEWTALQWAASYLVLHIGIEESAAAGYGGLFLLGMTIGRALSGFLTFKFNDTQMIRIGSGVVFIGLLTIILPLGITGTLIGLFALGLGCAPIYPSIIHSTPTLFGTEKSQAIIGIQMAAAYTGSLVAPPVLGLIMQYITPGFYPWFVLIGLVAMTIGHEMLVKKTAH
jgi:fucose permease